MKQERNSTAAAGLGLGLPSSDIMMGSSSLLGNKPTTLDLLGLGMRASPALLNSYALGGEGFKMEAAVVAAAAFGGRGDGVSSKETWDGATEGKSSE